MDNTTTERIQEWLHGNYDQQTKDAVQKMQQENPAELEDAFYKELELGTGGMRGIMGAGTNRMNQYTIGKATQGFANYLKKKLHRMNMCQKLIYHYFLLPCTVH